MGRVDVARPAVRVEDVGPDDWRRWRAVRLHSLAVDPAAFSSTFERQRSFPEKAWRCRLEQGPHILAAIDGADGGTDVGLAGAHLADGPDEPQLFGTWVDPPHRGTGIGELLVEAVVDRLAAAGHDHVRLWVAAGNDAARLLYQRCGFAREVAPATPSPGGCELAMVRTWPAGN